MITCLGQDLTLMNDQGVRVIETFLPQRTKNLFELEKS